MIGRNEEKLILENLIQSKKSEFVAVYGRRRVGKTYFIREVVKNNFTFYHTGLAKKNTQSQLLNFNIEINKKGNFPLAQNWLMAFQQLVTFINTTTEEKKVIFFDELPWMATTDSDFMEALEHFWNHYASARKDILLIVCGSAASWIIKNLLNNKGGLHNRVIERIKIQPFDLAECREYFKEKNAAFTKYQLVQLYMAIGGIPFYLDMVDISKSVAQNINDLCFTELGMLQKEFENLYASLFKNPKKHLSIIRALATKQKGLQRDELIKLAKLSNGGTTSDTLLELEQSGFIKIYQSFDKKQRGKVYQLIDFYSLFYLRFIEVQNNIDENYWLHNLDSPEVRTWSGYAFEQVCLVHLPMIKKALGINGMHTQASAWYGSFNNDKAQIDLLIDRKDGVINICEIKFSNNEFLITKKYAQEIRKKIGVFVNNTNTKKAIYFTLITTYGVVKNEYALDQVQNELTINDLF